MAEEKSSSLRITLDRIILGVKSLFLAIERSHVLSVLVSMEEEKDPIDSHQEEVNVQKANVVLVMKDFSSEM